MKVTAMKGTLYVYKAEGTAREGTGEVRGVWKIGLTIFLILAALVGAALFIGAKFRGAAASEITAVRVEPVARGDLVEIVAAPGEIQPLRKVSISAKVAAPIVELPHKEGEQVFGPEPTTQPSASDAPSTQPTTRPSLLVKLDDKDLQALRRSAEARLLAQEEQIKVARQRIESQRAQIRSMRAMLEDLERDLKRNKELLLTKDVSQSVVDTAQSKYDQQTAQIDSADQGLEADTINLNVMQHEMEAARADVAKADQDISYTVITSPLDGIVTSLKAEVGEMVVTGTMNNPGTVIMEVADLRQMLMVAHIDESQIDAVKEGQKALVRAQAYRDQVFEGVVQTVGQSKTSSQTDPTDPSRYFEAKILLDLKGRHVRSGISADTEIETKRHANVMKVPSQAVLGRQVDQLPAEAQSSPLIEKGKAFVTVVYRCINGKAVATPVSIGASDDTSTEIKAGLKQGDPIIVGPYKVLESLQDGQTVKTEIRPATQPATRP